GGVHGLVVVAEVDPATHAAHGDLPLLGEAEHARAASRVEAVDAVGLDVGFAVEVELVLDQALDRQAVAVPAEAALDGAALHRLVARDDVLDRAGEEMAVVRESGRERGPVVEDERRAIALAAGCRRAFAEAAAFDVALAPEREHVLLEL